MTHDSKNAIKIKTSSCKHNHSRFETEKVWGLRILFGCSADSPDSRHDMPAVRAVRGDCERVYIHLGIWTTEVIHWKRDGEPRFQQSKFNKSYQHSILLTAWTGPCFNIKTVFPDIVIPMINLEKGHETALSNVYDVNSYTSMMASLYWDGPLKS